MIRFSRQLPAKGDKAGAIADLEKAVDLDPANGQAKAQLQRLKGQ